MRLVRLIRPWLLIVALLTGQLTMLAHGFEHLGGGETMHACSLCLAGQNVDGPVPPVTPAALALCRIDAVFSSFHVAETASAPRIACPARGPPAA